MAGQQDEQGMDNLNSPSPTRPGASTPTRSNQRPPNGETTIMIKAWGTRLNPIRLTGR